MRFQTCVRCKSAVLWGKRRPKNSFVEIYDEKQDKRQSLSHFNALILSYRDISDTQKAFQTLCTFWALERIGNKATVKITMRLQPSGRQNAIYGRYLLNAHNNVFLSSTSGVDAENALKPRQNALKESRKRSSSPVKKKTTQHLLRI